MLSQKEIEIIVDTLKPYNPGKIGVFGSYARGENTEESDIDILYRFDSPISLFDKSGIKDRLEELLGKPVDLVSEQYLHPLLKKYILQDLQVIYAN